MLKRSLNSLLFLIVVTTIGCASVGVPDFKAHVTLPASGDGYWKKTLSDERGRIPKEQWEVMRKRGIIILSEDWKILRFTILKNCLTMECKNAVGALDSLFETIDKALEAMPKKKP